MKSSISDKELEEAIVNCFQKQAQEDLNVCLQTISILEVFAFSKQEKIKETDMALYKFGCKADRALKALVSFTKALAKDVEENNEH